MDLIYADASRKDIGVIMDCTFDLAFGNDENNFECTLDLNSHCCQPGYYLYMDGTEYGGIVDSLEVDTNAGSVTYRGRTWHGILAGKILCPDEGQDYLVVTGEANAVIGQLLERVGLSGLFQAAERPSGIFVSNYAMNRYVDAYTGTRKMLSSVHAKLQVSYDGNQVVLSVVPLADYSQDEEWDSSQIEFTVTQNAHPVNHMVCLGKGDLKERQVIHLYADTAGAISRTQSQFGQAEVAEVYDNPNAESLEELEEGGRERLEEAYSAAGTMEISFDGTRAYDIGDVVGARETVTGLFVFRSIVKKIVTINHKGINIEYKVGE